MFTEEELRHIMGMSMVWKDILQWCVKQDPTLAQHDWYDESVSVAASIMIKAADAVHGQEVPTVFVETYLKNASPTAN